VSDISIQEGGFLLIDKPREWTSFDVVKKLRNICRIKKIGHAGTLDPLATGLLIVCYGKYTKKIEGIQAQTKVYDGTFELGKTTPSFDLETEVDGEYPTEHINPELIEKTLDSFRGTIDQVPPQHSAVKIKGKRAYEHARKGKEVVLKVRQVDVLEYTVDTLKLPTLDFHIVCSKGTYIRSLASDLGKALDSGAYMSSLRRTKIGDYNVADAAQMKDITSAEDFFKFAKQFEA